MTTSNPDTIVPSPLAYTKEQLARWFAQLNVEAKAPRRGQALYIDAPWPIGGAWRVDNIGGQRFTITTIR